MEKTLLLASDEAWKALPKPLQDQLAAHGAPAAGLGLRAGAHLPPRTALDLAEQHADTGRILIADLRCAAALARLKEAGYIAERAGNCIYSGDAAPAEVAALPGDTLLEQLLRNVDAILDDKTTQTSLERQPWQRDGWAGLSAAGIDWTLAKAIAERDEVKRPTSADARADRFLDLADLTCLLVPGADEAQLARGSEAAATPDFREKANGYDPADPDPKQRNDGDYCQAMHRKAPVRMRPTLAIGTPAGTDPAAAHQLLLTTDRSRLPWLATLLDDPALQADVALRLDVGRFRCRLHAELRAVAAPGAMDRLVSRCLAVVLVHGRPLRHYDCTFLLPLDLHERDAADAPDSGLPAEVHKLLKSRVDDGTLDQLPPLRTGNAADCEDSAIKCVNEAITQAEDHPEQLRRLAAGLTDDEHLPHAQALLYFLPQVQRRVLDAEAGELDHWHLKPGNGAGSKLRVEKSEYGDITAPIRELSLYRYDQDSFLLALRCTYSEPDAVSAWAERKAAEPDAAAPTGPTWPDGDDWWHPLFTPRPALRKAIKDAQAERWLTFTKSARLLRAAFPEQRIEGKLHTVVLLDPNGEIQRFDGSRSVNPIVHRLLGLLLGPDAEPSGPRPTAHNLTQRLQDRLAAVRDDRMVVNVAYALAGPPPGADPAALDALRRLFSLALYVDRGRDAGADGWVYDRDFVAGQLAAQAEQRWAGLGTLIGCTNYSQAAVGCGALFCGPIARIHVPRIYGTMLVLSLLFDRILAHFEHRIAAETRRLEAPLRKGRAGAKHQAETLRRIERLHQDFIRFTNRTWLRHVSSQLQGEELFQRQAVALDLEAKYALVKDKLERTDELLQVQAALLEARQANRLAGAGVAAGLIGAAVALLGIAPALPPPPPPPPDPGWLDLARHLVLGNAPWVIGLLLLGYGAYRLERAYRQHDAAQRAPHRDQD